MNLLDTIESVISKKGLRCKREIIDSTEFLVGQTEQCENSNTYFVLDSLEGKNCIGHWIEEAAIYIPFIKKLKLKYPKIKILFDGYKRYKKQFCDLFEINEDDIIYVCDRELFDPIIKGRDNGCNHNRMDELYYPQDKEYTIIIPCYMYIYYIASYTDNNYYKLFNNFKQLLPVKENNTKDIECIYIIRSIKSNNENYKLGTTNRKFHNLDDVIETISNMGIPIYDAADFKDLKEQIDTVNRAKTIIVEAGSAMIINALLFSKNAHIILLNKPILCEFSDLELNLIKKHNTYEIVWDNSDTANIMIPIAKLEYILKKRLGKL